MTYTTQPIVIMAYVTQLLPDERTARLIRKALTEYMENHRDETADWEIDACWNIVAKISIDLLKTK